MWQDEYERLVASVGCMPKESVAVIEFGAKELEELKALLKNIETRQDKLLAQNHVICVVSIVSVLLVFIVIFVQLTK